MKDTPQTSNPETFQEKKNIYFLDSSPPRLGSLYRCPRLEI
ncbi:hypothetical protein [Bacteroides heparinolyticus]